MPDCRPANDDSAQTGCLRTLGPILVTAEPDHIGRYAASMALSSAVEGGTSVLPTYPITWLLHPAIKDAVLKLVGHNRIPVHVAQEITYRRPVEAGCSYCLTVTLAEAEGTGLERILVKGEVSTMGGEGVCSLAATLLIISLPAVDPSI
jgi:hypothetical protein